MLVLKCSLLNREYVLIKAPKALVSIVFMCSLHVIFLSNITSRYFTLFIKGMFRPLKLKLIYDRQSVGQSVLASGSHLERMTRLLLSL
jgi:hypothetical protein